MFENYVLRNQKKIQWNSIHFFVYYDFEFDTILNNASATRNNGNRDDNVRGDIGRRLKQLDYKLVSLIIAPDQNNQAMIWIHRKYGNMKYMES